MAVEKHLQTAEEFEAFAALPENANRRLEWIGGEIIEVVSNLVSSKIAALIIGALAAYLKTQPIGHVTGADGGYWVGKIPCIPDVGYISKKRQAKLPSVSYLPQAPDLVVEVVSPSDEAQPLTTKITNYLAAGVTAWVVWPTNKQVVIHAPGKQPQTLGIDRIIDGGDVLPGFTLPVGDIFEEEEEGGEACS